VHFGTDKRERQAITSRFTVEAVVESLDIGEECAMNLVIVLILLLLLFGGGGFYLGGPVIGGGLGGLILLVLIVMLVTGRLGTRA
jgi:hypothetical protein